MSGGIPTEHMVDFSLSPDAELYARIANLESQAKRQEAQLSSLDLQRHELTMALHKAKESTSVALGEALEWRSRAEGLQTDLHATRSLQDGAAPVALSGAVASIHSLQARLSRAEEALSRIASETEDRLTARFATEALLNSRTGSPL